MMTNRGYLRRRKQMEAQSEKDGKRQTEEIPFVRAERLRIFSDPWSGIKYLSCSVCEGRIGPEDRYCKHCGAKFLERGTAE